MVDNLLAAETVLSDGSVVVSSATAHPDLFWALRGAGPRFGVTTSLTLRAYPQGKVWHGFVLLPWERLDDMIAFGNWFHENQTGAETWLWWPAAASPGAAAGTAVSARLFYDGSEEEARRFYGPILDGPLLDTTAVCDYPASTDLSDTTMPDMAPPPRRLMGSATLSMPAAPEFVKELVDEVVRFFNDKGIPGSALLFEMVSNIKTCQMGDTATAYAARSRNMYTVAFNIKYSDAGLDAEIRAFQRKICDKITRAEHANGSAAHYPNYEGSYQGPSLRCTARRANTETETRLQPHQAFGANVAELQRIKKVYDPLNVFWKWHRIFPEDVGHGSKAH